MCLEPLRSSELVSLAYFAVLGLVAWLKPVSPAARARVSGLAVGVSVATVLGAACAAPAFGPFRMRDVLPLAFLLLAYWAPRELVSGVNRRFERWLLHIDAKVLTSPPGQAVTRAPRAVREVLELCYALVYLLVPAALLLLVAGGYAADADRFWTTVLTAEYACYGLLPLLPTRPPRSVETGRYTAPSTMRRLNTWILEGASNGWNTFPSGHVAGSLACGLAVAPRLPVAGAALMVIAGLIAVASVAGRYHYAADAAAGVLLALVVFAIVWL